MSSAPHVDPFTGTDWEECNGFIRALRFRALWEGKQRDPAWIADFATPHFSHQALVWHCRLPQDVRQDWFKLETALIERWAPSENNDGAQIKPTPAAAPSMSCTKNAELPPQGVIKVVFRGSDQNGYLHFDDGVDGAFTSDVGRAVPVRCNSLSNATLLEKTDGPCHSWLVVYWSGLEGGSTPNLEVGSTDYFDLSFVDSGGLKSGWPTGVDWQLMDCAISTNGEVIPRWKHDDTSTTLVPFVDSGSILLAVDPSAFHEDYPDDKRAKLFIQPAE